MSHSHFRFSDLIEFQDSFLPAKQTSQVQVNFRVFVIDAILVSVKFFRVDLLDCLHPFTISRQVSQY